jgi:hypothetical protein
MLWMAQPMQAVNKNLEKIILAITALVLALLIASLSMGQEPQPKVTVTEYVVPNGSTTGQQRSALFVEPPAARALAPVIPTKRVRAVAEFVEKSTIGDPNVPQVVIPPAVNIPTGRLGSVLIQSNGPIVRYWSDSRGVDVFREYDPDPRIIRLRILGYQPGVFKMIAYTAIADMPSEPAVCTVMVGDGPGPNPVPPGPNPVPPGPVPPPTPNDPLWSTLAAQFGADQSPNKKEQAKQLAAVYRQAVAVTINDASLKTINDFYRVVRDAAAQLVPLPALQPIRETIANELNAQIGTKVDVPLDSLMKSRISQQLTRFEKLLEALANG